MRAKSPASPSPPPLPTSGAPAACECVRLSSVSAWRRTAWLSQSWRTARWCASSSAWWRAGTTRPRCLECCLTRYFRRRNTILTTHSRRCSCRGRRSTPPCALSPSSGTTAALSSARLSCRHGSSQPSSPAKCRGLPPRSSPNSSARRAPCAKAAAPPAGGNSHRTTRRTRPHSPLHLASRRPQASGLSSPRSSGCATWRGLAARGGVCPSPLCAWRWRGCSCSRRS
mmetsp:Transcript_41674/g.101206  ORF Transcript_41674/g.101206 Transcript_41674/m.101206 type:complete len:227 (+) Transcript_41674:767-1447(+)